MEFYDRIIIGAGLYGLYAALYCGKRGQKVLVLECEKEAFCRATYANQARIHNGYHYPRSFSTVKSVTEYFEKFNKEYGFCINSSFKKIYATSARYSWTNASQFKRFCRNAGIKCVEIDPEEYFTPGMCDGAFEAEEYTYDAEMLKGYLMNEIKKHESIVLKFDAKVEGIDKSGSEYCVSFNARECAATRFVLNATYASTNQINTMVGFEPFKIKYELCEVILCRPGNELKNIGITVMDGPFFSIIPFGKTGLHSLTSVEFTPHKSCCENLPEFECQKKGLCSSRELDNCNLCEFKPESAWPYMSSLARKYMSERLDFSYLKSLFSLKPILLTSEIDDSRPTVIRKFSDNPTFVSVLSGKISTVYDLDEVLENGV
jgi:hypothetical protein